MENPSSVSLSKIEKMITTFSLLILLIIIIVISNYTFAQEATTTDPVGNATTTPPANQTAVFPLPPTNLVVAAAPSYTSVALHWTDNATNEDKFNIERKLTSATAWMFLAQIMGANVSTYYDATLSPGNSYDYRVQACLSGTGCSDYAYLPQVQTMTTAATTTGQTSTTTTSNLNIPLAPTDLSQVSTGGQTYISLHWTDNSNNENKFNIERKLSSAFAWMTLMQINASNVTNYIDNTAYPGYYYDYRVQACLSGVGCSDYVTLNEVRSGTAATTTTTTTTSTTTTTTNSTTPTYTGSGGPAIPLPPSALTVAAAPTFTSVYLHWFDNSTNEDKFNIEKRLSSAMAWMPVTQITQANVTSYYDPTLSPGISYDYRIQACLSGVGCSDYVYLYHVSTMSTTGITTSATTTINQYTSGTSTTPNSTTTTTTNRIPNAPTSLYQILTPNLPSVTLKWSDNATNEDKFNIERKLSSAVSWSYIYQIMSANATSYIDNTAVPGNIYDYRVQACLSGTGCSGYAFFSGASAYKGATSTYTTSNYQTSSSTTRVTSATSTTTTYYPASTSAQTYLRTNQYSATTSTSTTRTTQVNLSSTTAVTATSTTTVSNLATTTAFSTKTENLGSILDERRTLIADTKEQLIKIINDGVAQIIVTAEVSTTTIDISKVTFLKDELIKKIDSSLLSLTTVSSTDIDNLKIEISKGINNIKLVVGGTTAVTETTSNTVKDISVALSAVSVTVKEQAVILSSQGGDLLYKDTNKDGISDYDSINVYNMSAVAPSPVSTYEGKTITASDKVLLGFDPTKKELVKIQVEEPAASIAPVVQTYKVETVELNENKTVVLKGQALPNSFVTIYIYSTPIMVTVKTNSNGEWQYVMDKEIENGDHTVYTATVNNAGNIIAKSSGFIFTKTAEAASLKDFRAIQVTETSKPALLDRNSIVLLVASIIIIIALILIVIGMGKKDNEVTSQ